jgi:hypothetical protein
MGVETVRSAGSMCVVCPSGGRLTDSLPEVGPLRNARRVMSPDDPGCAAADMLVVAETDSPWAAQLLRSIRGNHALFLKPLMVVAQELQSPGLELADCAVPPNPAPDILQDGLEQLYTIAEHVGRLDAAEGPGSEGRLREVLVLRFLHTRPGRSLDPRRDIAARAGYSYPLLNALFGCDRGEELTVLDDLFRARLVGAELTDRVHLCPFCGHFHINFREVCPSCHTLTFTEEWTVHHFRCGYVGRESEYAAGSLLRCPKCRRQLRHLGVDHDRPAKDLWCTACGGRFSEPEVNCHCLHCDATFAPDIANVKDICRYSPTEEGRAVAVEGTYPTLTVTDILKGRYGFYRHEVFEELLRLEMLRCRRYRYDSTLVRMSLTSLDEAVAQQESEVPGQAVGELRRVFGQTFRETDILCESDGNVLLLIMTNTAASSAETGLARLEKKMAEALGSPIELEADVYELKDETRSADDILRGGG